MYAGNSSGYIPAVRDATKARCKRALKMLFPANNKHVDGLSSDGKPPYVQQGLLEHYIRKLNLKATVRSDLIAGDVTGQWGLYVDWITDKRTVRKLVKRNPILDTIDGEDVSPLELEDQDGDEYEDLDEEEIVEQGPDIFDFATEDLLVLPPTCMSVQKAKAAVLRVRMSPAKVQEYIDEGVIVLPPDLDVDDFCTPDKSKDKQPPDKKAAKDAGVNTQGIHKHAVVFMAFTKLPLVKGEPKVEAIVFYGQGQPVGIIRNPLWSGRRPIISEPVERIQGSFYGRSLYEAVKFLQWQLTDFWNMGQDSAMYSMMPIYAVDPTLCPQWTTLTMGLAAMWPVGKGGIQELTFPQLWKESVQLCAEMKRQIWESMDVNEAMMGKMPQGRKNNQLMGQMQQEQQTNIIDHASRYEEVMLNPLVEMLFEYDQQFRDDEIEIISRGEIGVKAKLEKVPVQQWTERFFFRWVGSEFEKNTQRMQQQIAWMNVLKGVPPQMLNGKTLDLNPILEAGTEALFGPEVAPRILVDKSNQYTIDPMIENELIFNGFDVEVHEADNDQLHMQAHMASASKGLDPLGLFKKHIIAHGQQMQRKRQMANPPPQQGQPGAPGGAGPGVAGAPRPGAQPGPPKPMQQPPGAVGPDAMGPGRG